jgi:hypothetical protein
MYNNNQPTPTVNGYAFFNRFSAIDKTMLSFSMWKTTIKIAIYPLIESENDDQIKYDRKGGISIYLTPFKAHMFAQILKGFKHNPDEYHAKGVPSGQALITVEDPSKGGYKNPEGNPLIVIRKVNPEGGVEMAYAYEIASDPYGVIENYNQETGEFTKNTEQFKYEELDLIALQLESYCEAMSNTQAFAVNEQTFQHLDKIANKLGVELMSYSTGTSYRNNSYFNSNAATGDASSTGSNTGVMGGTSSSLANMI